MERESKNDNKVNSLWLGLELPSGALNLSLDEQLVLHSTQWTWDPIFTIVSR